MHGEELIYCIGDYDDFDCALLIIVLLFGLLEYLKFRKRHQNTSIIVRSIIFMKFYCL